MKKILVILFSILFAVHLLPPNILAQQPEWNVEVKQGTENAELLFQVFNNTPEKMTLEFSSSKFFDFEVMDKEGNKVFRYSDNKAFLQAIQHVTLKRGETKVWRDKWDYTTTEGKRVPPGEYIVKAYLMVRTINGKPAEAEFVQTKKLTVEAENPSFRNVELSPADGSYIVKGEAKVSAGCFYYTVEDGHNILIEETLVKVNKEYPNWTAFSFTFDFDPEEVSKNRPVLLNLYERDLKEGTIYHNYTLRLN
ncbi:BsuPI-related putative proteinase inhibitor [Bacillus sp. SG-1]|uniref:BsuPI-related putative proteinase inhibitor n=1 Tax=Bacillus sp. SG-1 TaxID=161544 RepID=UPI00015445F8|nr:BsuPI-related putative proteinase inhibitor [Bacillus sp. SG-1]EDL62769.1 Ipi [Bacillus sp. SG-1]